MKRAPVPTPILINHAASEASILERQRLSEHNLDEGWLQNLLFRYPSVLPIDDIDAAFAPILPIAREVGTDVGRIDALFISPGGLLTVVEAKLWHNPGARREVVAQIIDYAKELATWGYEELDQLARRHHQRSLWELVCDTEDENALASESRFVDEVTRNLQRGRFLLLIAGDGIREDVERMTAFLQATPHLHFTLALVELNTFNLPDQAGLLVTSNIVSRTKEVVRAVVRVENRGGASTQVDVGLAEEPASTRGERRTLAESDFHEKLASDPNVTPQMTAAVDRILKLCRTDPGLDVRWNMKTFAVLANIGAGPGNLPSMLSVGDTGVTRFHHVAFRKKIEKRGVPPNAADATHDRYRRGLIDLFGPEVTEKGMVFHTGPRFDLDDEATTRLEALITRTVRDLEDAIDTHAS